MALRPYPGFVGPSYTPQSKIAAYDRTVNWYPEQIESGTGNAGARYVLYPTPGVTETSSPSSSDTLPGRGGLSIIERGFYYVVGSTFYQLGIGPRGFGLSNTSNDPVYIITNGDAGQQLLIASDGSTYSYSLDTHILTTIQTAGVHVSIGFVDGYGIALDPARSEISVSASEDFSSWDPGDIGQRTDAADRWERLLIHYKELWLFGDATSSVWANAGTEGVVGPFAPISSVFIPIGIAARNSAVVVGNAPMWLGQSADGIGIVYRANGYTPERVSTHAVEDAFRIIFNTSSNSFFGAEGSTYQENGHVFYELTFPADPTSQFNYLGATWVYDVTSGFWHERGNWSGLVYGCLGTRGHIPSSGLQYTLSRTNGKVFLQSIDVFKQTDGSPLRRLRRAPHLNQAQQRIRYSHVRLLMETGLGLVTGQGSDPLIYLSWSDDGGQTFGPEYAVSAGKLGEYSQLVDWWQLGQGRDRIFEVTCSDPIPFRIVDALVDFSVGPS